MIGAVIADMLSMKKSCQTLSDCQCDLYCPWYFQRRRLCYGLISYLFCGDASAGFIFV